MRGRQASNKDKHGVLFEEAITTFDDPFAMIAPDPKHSVGEERGWLIGEADSGRILVSVYTMRGSVTRVISARPANHRERRIYEAFKRVPL